MNLQAVRLLLQEHLADIKISFGIIINNAYLSTQISIRFTMNRIKEVLTHKGISQTCLAEKMDKSYANTYQYARNKRQPSFKDLYIISEILQVNAKNLLVNTENNTGK